MPMTVAAMSEIEAFIVVEHVLFLQSANSLEFNFPYLLCLVTILPSS